MSLASVSIATVPSLRPSHVDQLRRLGLLTVGSVASVPCHELAARMQVSREEAAAVVCACDAVARRGAARVQSLAELFRDCNDGAGAHRRRATRCAPIDALLGGGFRHGAVSEVFGLPGTGKTQLAMQLAAAATLPAVLDGLPRRCPILVIDSEGSWTVERFAQLCGAFASRFKASIARIDEHAATSRAGDDAAAAAAAEAVAEARAAASAAAERYRVRDAVDRVRFIRCADLATVSAALLLFRENVLESRASGGDDGDAGGDAFANGADDGADDDDDGGVDDDDGRGGARRAGGLLIVDSVAAIFKEARVGADAVAGASSLGSASALGAGPQLNRAQGVAALARLLQSIASETNAAVVVTNQMTRRWDRGDARGGAADGAADFDPRGSGRASGGGGGSVGVPAARFVPALGESWAATALVRVELRRVPGAPFTSQSRVCRVVRTWDVVDLSASAFAAAFRDRGAPAEEDADADADGCEGASAGARFARGASVVDRLLRPASSAAFRIGTTLDTTIDADADTGPSARESTANAAKVTVGQAASRDDTAHRVAVAQAAAPSSSAAGGGGVAAVASVAPSSERRAPTVTRFRADSTSPPLFEPRVREREPDVHHAPPPPPPHATGAAPATDDEANAAMVLRPPASMGGAAAGATGTGAVTQSIFASSRSRTQRARGPEAAQ
jgi:RecA/RadA recombinase